MNNKIINNCFLIVIVIVTVLGSCTKFEDLNTNTKRISKATGPVLFTFAQKELSDHLASTNVNVNVFRLFAQYWTETVYIDEANFNIVSRSQADRVYSDFYVNVLVNLKEAKKLIQEEIPVTKDEKDIQINKLAVINVLESYAYSIVFELFGDMPYTDAFNIDNVLPKYDDAKTVYYTLIDSLNSAINRLKDASNGNNISMGEADLVYNGDVSKWLKFANSLKLRMAIMIAKVDKNKAISMITEAMAPANGGLINSNDDNYALKYLPSTPNTNPLYVDLVQSNRKDFVGANTLIYTLIDTINNTQDPRIEFYFDTLSKPDTLKGINKFIYKYKGGVYGASSDADIYSNPSQKIKDPTLEGLLLDYAEVQFYLAEATEKKLISGTTTAEDYYKKGIEASIKYWGGTDKQVTDYLILPTVAYTYTTGGVTPLQQIATQSWIAFYNRGYEGWTVWRRLGYPNFHLPDRDAIPVPYRFTYPINEQTRNGVNYAKAAAAIGGDLLSTKLWWNK